MRVTYSRSGVQSTLLMSYICVTALLIERGARLDGEHFALLAAQLQLQPPALSTHFRCVLTLQVLLPDLTVLACALLLTTCTHCCNCRDCIVGCALRFYC
jgi:hypothetical protein